MYYNYATELRREGVLARREFRAMWAHCCGCCRSRAHVQRGGQLLRHRCRVVQLRGIAARSLAAGSCKWCKWCAADALRWPAAGRAWTVVGGQIEARPFAQAARRSTWQGVRPGRPISQLQRACGSSQVIVAPRLRRPVQHLAARAATRSAARATCLLHRLHLFFCQRCRGVGPHVMEAGTPHEEAGEAGDETNQAERADAAKLPVGLRLRAVASGFALGRVGSGLAGELAGGLRGGAGSGRGGCSVERILERNRGQPVSACSGCDGGLCLGERRWRRRRAQWQGRWQWW